MRPHDGQHHQRQFRLGPHIRASGPGMMLSQFGYHLSWLLGSAIACCMLVWVVNELRRPQPEIEPVSSEA